MISIYDIKSDNFFKRPIIVLAFLLSCVSNVCYSNEAIQKIDSLIQLTETDISDSARLHYYLDISYYYQPIDSLKMWEYYNKTVNLATQVDRLGMVASAQMDIGNWYYYNGNINEAEDWYKKAIKQSRNVSDLQLELLLWLNIAELEVTRNNYERHIVIVDSCLQLAIEHHIPDVEMPCYGLYGLNYWRMGEYDKAMEYSFKSLKMAEDLGWIGKVLQLHNNIGLIYRDREEYDKALTHLKMSLQTNYFIDPETYHHIGRIYMKQGKEDLAVSYLDSAMDLSVERDDFDLQSGVHNSIAELDLEFEKYDKAISHLKEALRIIDSSDQEEYLGRVYLSLSKAFSLKGENDLAILYGNLAIKRTSEFEEKEILSKAYLGISKVYQKSGNFESALIYIEKFNALKNLILNEKKLKNISLVEIKYETAKKDLEIERSRQNLKVLQVEKQDLWIKMILGLVLIGFVFVAAFASISVRTEKKKKLMHENFTQQLIQSQEEERKRISSDLHDSIGQNLLLIKSSDVVSANKKLSDLVSETLQEVRSISKDLHPVQLERLGFTKAIELMIDKCDMASDIVFSDELEPIDGLLTAENEINIYRIIQEGLNNILKHSKAKSAKLKSTINDKSIVIEIQDNGVGFDFERKMKESNSLGLITLRERIKLMKGKMIVSSEINTGTNFTFVIPRKS
jgi:signal transduction histidine kinase/Tfp pilus assembly protein PilF